MPEEFATLGLTKRENDILQLAIEGKTDKEIASSLLIGTETVKSLWERLRAKLGAKNRSHAIAILFTRAQVALTDGLQRATTLLDSELFAVVLVDFEGRVLDANGTLLTLSGYGWPDVSNMTLYDLIPPYQHASLASSLNQIRDQGRIEPVRRDWLAKEGSRIPVLFGGARLQRDANRAVCYVIKLPKAMFMGED
jgi:PAS domain S-box-containing protein